MTCGCGFTRREVLRAGSLVAAGLLAGGKLGAQAKKGMRIDIHAHLWNDEYLDLCQSYGNVDTGTQRNKGAGMGQEEIEKRFALMDANGVDMQILDICPQAPHFENKEHAVNAARMANDLYAEAVSRWPKKFKAFAAVPLPHVDEALKELERALDQLKFVGATITTFIGNRSVADPAFAPFYQELNRRASVLYIHPSGNGIDSPFVIPYNLRWAIGAPMEDTVSIMHLIEAGIPQKYPKLKIVNSHLGGMIPMVFQRSGQYFQVGASLAGAARPSQPSACGIAASATAIRPPFAPRLIPWAQTEFAWARIFRMKRGSFTITPFNTSANPD